MREYFAVSFALMCAFRNTIGTLPALEVYHNPSKTKTPLDVAVLGGDRIHDPLQAPDFREEHVLLPPRKDPSYSYTYPERNRPYRMSPFGEMYKMWKYVSNWDNPHLLGCYCMVAYKRTVPLAGCAVITIRHVLTTAWPTHTILKRHSAAKRLVDILGWWYNINEQPYFNTTRYMTPARIHFHPQWLKTEQTNASHPFPVVFDLALYTGLFPMHWSAYICQRAGPNWSTVPSTDYSVGNVYIAIGAQFMRAYNRRPTPWHMYGVRTIDFITPCPKADWSYYLCFGGRWAPLGMDSGAPLHRSCNAFVQWRKYDGLLAMNTISIKLRSNTTVHYFMEINNHPVLDFLYDAYMGTLKYEFLDERYGDVHYGPLTPYKWYYIPWKQDDPIPTQETKADFWDG